MKLWLESANPSEIESAFRYPLVGIITNPKVIERENQPWQTTIQILDRVGKGPVHLQTLSQTVNEIIEEVKIYKKLLPSKPLSIKLPCSAGSIEAIPKIHEMGHSVLVTSVCCFNQAMIALESGIEFLAIYCARLSESGGDGFALVEQVRNYIERENFSTEIMAASIRNEEQLDTVAQIGAHAVAISYGLLMKTFDHELTQQSIQDFQTVWSSIPKS